LKEEGEFAKEDGGRVMNIEKGMEITSEEFVRLNNEYGGFNSENYHNHQTHDSSESFYDYIRKGSEKIKNIRLLKNAN
jgi:hypothetical protein